MPDDGCEDRLARARLGDAVVMGILGQSATCGHCGVPCWDDVGFCSLECIEKGEVVQPRLDAGARIEIADDFVPIVPVPTAGFRPISPGAGSAKPINAKRIR